MFLRVNGTAQSYGSATRRYGLQLVGGCQQPAPRGVASRVHDAGERDPENLTRRWAGCWMQVAPCGRSRIAWRCAGEGLAACFFGLCVGRDAATRSPSVQRWTPVTPRRLGNRCEASHVTVLHGVRTPRSSLRGRVSDEGSAHTCAAYGGMAVGGSPGCLRRIGGGCIGCGRSTGCNEGCHAVKSGDVLAELHRLGCDRLRRRRVFSVDRPLPFAVHCVRRRWPRGYRWCVGVRARPASADSPSPAVRGGATPSQPRRQLPCPVGELRAAASGV